jgi:hypothetical protein
MKLFSLFCATALLSVVGTSANASSLVYEYTGATQQFTVPLGVTSVRVFAIGGGGGGANGHQGGGGAGYIASGTFSVTPSQVIPIDVGHGGTGALTTPGNEITGLTPGSASTFGAFVTASGGGVVSGVNQGGHNGSSGGGAATNAGPIGGNGGSGGSDGFMGSGFSMPIGLGSGDYSAVLASFSESSLTAGAGGLGGHSTHSGGGGAGGVLINGFGPTAESGLETFSAQGGKGYGAGGGAGGYNGGSRIAGGDGANGVVYLEYTAVPEPASLTLLAIGSLCLINRRRA